MTNSNLAAPPDTAEPGAITTQTRTPDTIEIVHEDLRVEKQAVETGRVSVRTSVTEHDETVALLLRQQDVSVERVSVGRVVSEAPAIRQEGDTVIIPILEEILVVEKRLVLKEELHIRTDTTERLERRTVTLRTEQADISELPGTKPR